MRVVIGCDVGNPYVSQLAHSLSDHHEVEAATDSLDQFWRRADDVDILHIQWPEALFNWKDPTLWEIAYLSDVLDEWSSKSRIVTTVHNYKPHGAEKDGNWKRLYRLVYRASDGIVHLGETSRNWFIDRYDFATEKYHAVIPHGNYTCFPDRVDSTEARNQLDLGPKESVYLFFGNMRHPEEANLLIEAFDHLGVRRKRLLIAGRLPPISSRTLRYWRIRYDPRFRTHEGYIPDDEVQLYLRAADVLIIPREGVLNSGNVALGFTFGQVVVGPDEGVIGEVLHKTGNPVYEPGDAYSLARALGSVIGDDTQIGDQNRAYAMEEMDWNKVASGHVDVYRNVLT